MGQNTATKTLKEANRKHTEQRDRRVTSFTRVMSRWARSLERSLLGTLSADRGGTNAVRRETDAILATALPEAAVVLRRGLANLAMWSWDDEAAKFVRAIPIPFWLRRVMPIHTLFSTEGQARAELKRITPPNADLLELADRFPAPQEWYDEATGHGTQAFCRPVGLGQSGVVAEALVSDGASLLEFAPDASFDIDAAFRKILAGELSRAETLDLIRELEFGSPTPEQLNAILEDSAWPDGLNAMDRIVTVPRPQIGELRSKIHEYLALPGPDRGSAWGALASDIGDLVGNVNFKAVRIARTEGTRVAEDMLRQSWKDADEFIVGIQAFTANDANVRDEHRHWHEKIYRKTSDGQFIATDGEHLPRFPAGPNCRCWDSPVMVPEIEAEIANVTVGPEYQAALDRFEREKA